MYMQYIMESSVWMCPTLDACVCCLPKSWMYLKFIRTDVFEIMDVFNLWVLFSVFEYHN